MRLTHIPTGIAVVCQADRSQHRNRAQAWDMLRARLYESELKKREEKAAADQAAKTDIGWGHQIRSYVLQPYQMVKDLRTGVQTSDTGGVLDGDLDEFMAAALAQKAFGTAPGASRTWTEPCPMLRSSVWDAWGTAWPAAISKPASALPSESQQGESRRFDRTWRTLGSFAGGCSRRRRCHRHDGRR